MQNDDLYIQSIQSLESGDLDSAKSQLELLMEREPTSQRVAVLSARHLELRQAPQKAMALLQTFVSSNPDNAVARTNLARLQLKSGDRSKALSTLRFGLMQNPNQERSLHLYAAMLQEEDGLPHALAGLKTLAMGPSAWLPAWVAAQLAAAQGAEERIGDLLVDAATRAEDIFPPSLPALTDLLEKVPNAQFANLCLRLRSYCSHDAQAWLDQRLERHRPLTAGPGGAPSTSHIEHSVWRHLISSSGSCSLGIAPIHCVRPETWGVAEISGRLSRGFALLLAELLDSQPSGPAASVFIQCRAQGLMTGSGPANGAELAARAQPSHQHLLSSYLSAQGPEDFILDAEIYDTQGIYLARESCRAKHPGHCLGLLANRLGERFSKTEELSGPQSPSPGLEVEDALARDAAATFLLLGEKTLGFEAVKNPGLLLDRLVHYALDSETESALLTLWAGIEAAAQAEVPGAQAQRDVMAGILDNHPELAAWTRKPEGSVEE